LDAAQQRKLNRSLQINNELLNKNLQSLTDKYKFINKRKKNNNSILLFRLTHTERDVASKRLLIENYKTRLNEMETTLNHSNEKNINEVNISAFINSLNFFYLNRMMMNELNL